MKALLPYFKLLNSFRLTYASGLLMGLLYGACSGFGMAFITAKIVPLLLSGEEASFTRKLLIISLIPGVAVVKAISGYSSNYLMSRCQRLIELKLQLQLMEFLQSLSLAFFHKNRTGGIMARVINDSARIAGAITHSSAELIRQPVAILGAFGVIIYQSYQNRDVAFLAVALFLLPVCIFMTRMIGKRMTVREIQDGENEGAVNSIIQENITAARETRAFNLQERETTRFKKRAKRQMKIGMRIVAYRNAISPATEVITSIGVAAALLHVTRSEMTVENVAPLLVALYLCYDPWKSLGKTFVELQRASLAVDRMQKIYQTRHRLEDPEDPVACPTFQKSLVMRRVHFAYHKRDFVLEDVNLKIRKGEVVALIGPSGAGKSTASHLLCRFYDPKRGVIKYDGHDLRQFRQADLRDHIAFVPQDTFLFADTVMNNIRVGRLDASDQEVFEAARKANAHDFIETLPDGYQNVVSERGASLSGGQKQRISIARAFLRNSDILILDEATSSLDSDSETIVHQALERLFNNRTVIIIAHRYSTIRMADRIILFNKGRVVLEGDEETLERQSAFFQRLKFSGSDKGLEL